MSSENKHLTQKVTVKGYVSSTTGKDGIADTEFYVFESTNFTAMLPGQKVVREQLDRAIAEGVTVVVKRK